VPSNGFVLVLVTTNVFCLAPGALLPTPKFIVTLPPAAILFSLLSPDAVKFVPYALVLPSVAGFKTAPAVKVNKPRVAPAP
jgi:hypothetical protein